VISADPYYRFQHDRQETGLDGLNLEDSCRRDIEVMAKKITQDSIEKFNDSQFHVASQTKSGHFYAINLTPPTCNCQDFPRIWFCKHIGAIYFHFPHLHLSNVPATSPAPSEPEHMPTPGTTTSMLHLLIQDVNVLRFRTRSLLISPISDIIVSYPCRLILLPYDIILTTLQRHFCS